MVFLRSSRFRQYFDDVFLLGVAILPLEANSGKIAPYYFAVGGKIVLNAILSPVPK